MSNELANKSTSISEKFQDFVNAVGLDDVKMAINTKNGTTTISGHKEGLQYTTTIKQEAKGMIQTSSQFDVNMSKDLLSEQIKELRKQGYKQKDIANMLGVSQATVSNYGRK